MLTMLSFVGFIPTIVFLVVLLIGFLMGLWRGLRKSVKLLINCAICTVLAIIFYFVIINIGSADYNVISIPNMILGAGGLQRMLGVSETNQTLSSVLTEIILKNNTFGTGFDLIVTENGAYLATLVQVAYNGVMAIISYIFYLFILFIGYLVYLFAFPERRRKKLILEKQKEEADAENDTNPSILEVRGYNRDEDDDVPISKKERKKREKMKKLPSEYKPRHLWGSAIGFVRGLFTSWIYLSFVGTILFIATGGVDKDSNVDISFDSPDIANAYGIYGMIDEYDDFSIYKVLNAMRGTNNVPLYLFASNIVLSANIKDDANGVNDNVYLVQEASSYVAVSRQVITVLMKYGKDDINKALSDNQNGNIGEAVANVLKIEAAQKEIENVINDFNFGTYLSNFAVALINSTINHIDELNIDGLTDDTKDLIKVLFKKGYLSDKIPSEKALKDEKEASANPDDERYVLACLKPQNLLKKEDALVALNILFKALNQTKTDDSTYDTINLVKDILPYIKDLSVLSTDRKDELNPVYARLYNYVDNVYLCKDFDASDAENSSRVINLALEDSSINWVNELQKLVDVIDAGLSIYANVYDKNDSMSILNMFDDTKAYYQENVALFDKFKNTIQTSLLLDKVLNTKLVKGLIEMPFKALSDSIRIPDSITYSGENGELNSFISFFEIILKDKETRKAIQNLATPSDEIDFNDLKTILNTTKNNYDAISDSTIFKSVLSGYITNFKNDDLEIIVPKSLIDNDGIIDIEELDKLVISLLEVIPDEEFSTDAIVNNILKSATNVFESQIFKATAAYLFVNTVSGAFGDFIVIPDDLIDCGTKESLEKERDNPWFDEIDAIFKDLKILIKSFDSSNSDNMKNQVFSSLKDSDKDTVETILKSKVFDATTTKLIGDAYSQEGMLASEVVDSVKVDGRFTVDEIYDILLAVKALDLDLDNISFDDKKKNITSDNISKIYAAKLNKHLVTKFVDEALQNENIEDIKATIVTNEKYPVYDDEEVKKLVSGLLDLGLSFDNTNIDANIIKDKSNEQIENVYDSTIVRFVLTNKLDGTLDSSLLDVNILPSCKTIDKVTNEPVYKVEEVTSLVAAISLLDISVGSDPDVGSIISKVTDETNGDDNINTLYASTIIRGVVTKKLDDNLVDRVDEGYIEASKTIDGASLTYSKSEFKALIKSIDNVDLYDEYKKEFVDLNADVLKSADVEILYGSTVIKGIIKKSLDEAFIKENPNDSIVSTDVLNACKVKINAESDLLTYSKDEVNALIKVAILLNTGMDANPEISTILKLKVDINSEDDDINTLYKSTIIRSVITNKLDENIANEYDSYKSYSKITDSVAKTVNVYNVNEVKGLIDAINHLGLYDNETKTINTNVDADSLLDKKDLSTEVLYESTIVKGIINKSLDNAFSDVDSKVRSACKLTLTTELYAYKKTELDSLLDAARVLNVGMNANPEISTILNLKVDINSEDDDINTLYKSTIIRSVITNKLDENISNKYDSYKSYSKITDSVAKTVYVYNVNEVKGLIDAINHLGLYDNETKTINTNVDANSLLEKKDLSTAVLYESTIVKGIINNSLDNAFSDVDSKVLSACKLTLTTNLYAYKKTELDSLLEAARVLNVGMNANPDVSTILDLEVNPTGKDSINTLYNSTIIRSVVTKKLDDSVSPEVGAGYIQASKTDDDVVDGLTVYKLQEVKSLILAVKNVGLYNETTKELKLELDADSLLDDNVDLNVLYKSTIVKGIINDTMDKTFEDIEADIRLACKEEIAEDLYTYQQSEVKKILDAIKVLGINTNDRPSASSLMDKDVLGKIYDSVIIKSIITTQIDSTLKGSGDTPIISDAALAASKELGVKNYYFYTINQLNYLVDSINALEVDVDNVSSISGDALGNISENIDTLYKSYIIMDKITTSLDNIIASNEDLVNDSNAKVNVNNDFSIYKKDEIVALSSFAENGLSSASINITLNDTTIKNICNSIILTASISVQLSEIDGMIIPTSIVDDGHENIYINSEELANLLSGISSLGVTNALGVNFANLALPSNDSLKKLAESTILRATIGSKVKTGDTDKTLYVLKSNMTKEKDIKENDIIVISKTEFINLFEGLNAVNNSDNYNISINFDTLKTLEIDTIYKLFESTIFAEAISNCILSYRYSFSHNGFSFTISYSSITCDDDITLKDDTIYEKDEDNSLKDPSELDYYNLTTIKEVKRPTLTAQDVEAFFKALNSIIN